MTELLGQVGISTKASTWVQRGVEAITRAPVHHIVICISDTECISAEPGGAKIKPLDYRDDIIWSHFNFAPEQAQACADWARAREGRPYNFINCALIGFYCVTRIPLPRLVTDRFITDKSYQCAQFADSALTQGAGIKIFDDNRYRGGVHTGSFGDLFKEQGWWLDSEPQISYA